MNLGHLKPTLLRATRALGLLGAARRVTSTGFRVIGFHGVSLADEHVRFPTLFISPESFERRLRFLRQHYDVVPLAEVIEQHQRGRIKPRQVVLTFDDGFYNFLSAAIPLLRTYDAPATVYVVSGDLDDEEPLYNLLLKDAALASPLNLARGLPEGVAHELPLTNRRDREQAAVRLASAVRHRPDRASRLALCRALGEVLQVDIDRRIQERHWSRLNSQEVRDVARLGYDVQLHTHSHHNVVEHRGQVREELRENRRVLEGLTGRPATDFCYPLGLWDRAVWDDLRAEGVRSAVTTRNGPNFASTPPLSLRRHLTGEAMTDAEFEFELSGLRWLAHAVRHPGARHAPSEKRVRYSVQPDLY